MMHTTYQDLAPALLVDELGPIRILTLNAPERMNSVDDAMHDSLRDVWDMLSDDDSARAAVLTGSGRAFCAGGHIPNFARSHQDSDARRRETRHQERLVRAMIDCEVPVVAAVNGPAIGFGASLAMLCDLIVMSDEAFLCDPHVGVGVVAGDGGAVTWPLAMSLHQAKEHLLLGDRLSATECFRLGIANRVERPDTTLKVATELAGQIAERPSQAVRDTKRALNTHLRHAADLALSIGLATERESFGIGDFSEEVRQMLEAGGH